MGTRHRSNRVSNAEMNKPNGKFNVLTGMYIGVVMENVDAQSMGRLSVWIPEMDSDPLDDTSWFIVGYCSPFAGSTDINGVGKNDESFNDTQSSYGMWMASPDIGNMVAVFFANGDPANGWWFGCMYHTYTNNSVPDQPFETNFYGGTLPAKYKSIPLPTAEYNKTSRKVGKNATKPVHTTRFKGIAAQGLIKDKIRGMSTSNARRESPSQVFGISTPGPINPDSPNKKGRLGGSALIMDDKLGSEHITLKTRSGAQIRIDETNGLIYIINKKGTGWIQMDEDGNGDMFFAKNFSVHAGQDINFLAEGNVNIDAGGDVNFNSVGKIGMNTADIHMKGTGGIFFDAQTGSLKFDATCNINSPELNLETSGVMNLLATTISMSGGAGGVSVDASGVKMAGATVSVNGASPTAAGPATTVSAVVKSPSPKTLVLETFTDEYNIDRNTSTVDTIVSRLPTYEPCPEHKVK